MAVTAIDSEASDMMLVAEGRRLGPCDSRISDIGRALELHAGPQHRSQNKNCAKNRSAGNCIRTAMEDLHRRLVRRPLLIVPVLAALLVQQLTRSCDIQPENW